MATQPQELNQTHLECIRLMLEGKRQREIAKIIGVDETTICVWKRTQIFVDELSRQNKERFKLMAVEAAKEIQRLASSAKNENVRLQASKDILDRAGLKPKDEQDISLRQIDISIDYGDKDGAQ